MIDSSRVIVQAEAMLRRISPRGRRLARRARRRRWRMFIRRLARAALAMLAVAFAAGMFGLLVFPLGTEGLMLAFVAKIGRAHVRTPVTNAHLVCRLLLETKKQTSQH